MAVTKEAGYFRFPTVHHDRVVFVSEDDLWEVPLSGGTARRLTSGLGEARYPVFSPDGAQIAFTGEEEGAPEIYVIDAGGGPVRRLTYHATQCAPVTWTPDGTSIVFRSNHRHWSPRRHALFAVSAEGGEARGLPYGEAHWLSFEPGGQGRVLGRNADDLARWKRYRGGTAGVVWIDRAGDGNWERLFRDRSSGLARPMWIGERIYFICDEEGHGNLYSCLPDGEDLRRHTDHVGFYARFAHTDGDTIVYTCGGRLYRFDPATEAAERIEVEYPSPRTQLNRKFVDAEDYLDDVALHPKGHSLVVTTRGKPFNFGNWEGAVRQTGVEHGVRYRLPHYLADGKRIVMLSDATGEEQLEIHDASGAEAPRTIELDVDLGRATDLWLSPTDDALVLTNHRHELIWVDLEQAKATVMDRSSFGRIEGVDWSPDGRWIAYGFDNSHRTSVIKIADVASGEVHTVTTGEFRDVEPCFDPRGRYLYFLSHRYFDPVYDSLFFDISFPKSMKPCVLTLREDVESLFYEKPRPLDGEDEDEEEAESKEDGKQEDEESSDDAVEPVEIDFEHIAARIESFPVPTGDYGALAATEDRVFWTLYPTADDAASSTKSPSGKIQYFALESREKKTFARGYDHFVLSQDRKTMALVGEGIRVVSTSSDGPDEDAGDHPSRKSGWINLDRLAVPVEPLPEWRQMLREAWRLMRDHYWREDMCGVDWNEVWQRYHPLVERVSSRSEFSDLVWTMQGEMGTSHAYEMGGDYRRPPQYRPGFLGIDVAWNSDFGAYRIEYIIHGDTWSKHESSPLARAGVRARVGDYILAINGKRLDEHVSVQQRLVNLAGEEVELTLANEDGERWTQTVQTLRSEFPVRYRDWVETNRKKVHAATDGQVGYLHVPDMSAHGFAEFHRGFLGESSRRGLIVDVRNNGGGHVSQLLLEKLARRRLGYDINRWGSPVPYPEDSMAGPMVALTDEHAGSDGDIFSHCFKLMKLGPLVGKRTWGGVIGIWPRHGLVDGSWTTQPEFSFWFEDVGYAVENYGTDPDVEVEMPPGVEARGEDPQLEHALEIVHTALKESPPVDPDFGEPPRLAPPRKL